MKHFLNFKIFVVKFKGHRINISFKVSKITDIY